MLIRFWYNFRYTIRRRRHEHGNILYNCSIASTEFSLVVTNIHIKSKPYI